ncbi:MAG: hypothetical protein QOJ58_3935 [Alphaproteobacteria bacterium]|nr:hypothetical protein [Alphaproteobacteria bacterium]
MARSAAPDNVSSRASIKIFTTSGFKVAFEGDNGFVCTVLRGWAAPTYGPAQFRDYVYVADLRAPICFDAVSARTMMPYYELRHLGHGLIYPHLMLFLPYYDNAMLGGNERRSGLPFLSDDPGTPFAVTVIPVDKAFANKASVK